MTSTWLPQRPPGTGAVLLRDYPGPVVGVACTKCDRAGRYALATLLRRYGPAAGLPGVLAALSADCPRRITGQQYDLCGTHFPDLGGRRGGGANALEAVFDHGGGGDALDGV